MKHHFSLEITPDPLKLQETITLSKAAFLAGESEGSMSRLEFLYQQSRYIRKRCWLLQGVLLAATCLFLMQTESSYVMRRCLGTSAPLFGILILPEIWKNRSCEALEVECTTLYPLRAIYAARLTLFAGVDLVLLSLFFTGASLFARIPLWEMLIQFLLPFNVTCCICFQTLYSKRINSEALSMLLCIIWAGLWSLLILTEEIYDAISVPMWIGMLAASFCCLGYTLIRGQKKWQNILEVKPLWT